MVSTLGLIIVLFSLFFPSFQGGLAQAPPESSIRRRNGSGQGQVKRNDNADKWVQAARKLMSEWIKSETNEAIRNYERAEAVYEAIGNTTDQISALLEMGQAQESLANPSAGLASYEKALSVSRRTRQQFSEASALNRLGFLCIERSEFDKAASYGEQAYQLSLSIADRRDEALSLLLLGTASYHIRKTSDAKIHLQRSLDIFKEIGNDVDRAMVLEALGHLSHESGNPKEALQLFSESLELAGGTNNALAKGKALNGIAISCSILGEKQQAIERYRQAIAIFESMGNGRYEAVALNGLGFIYYSVAENEAALNYYSRALKLFKSVGDREGQSIALARVGRLSERLWDKKTAVQYYEQLLLVTRQLNDPIFESYVLNWLGDVYLASDRQRTLTYYSQALALSRLYSNPRIEAHTLNRLGYANALLGATDSARDFYNHAREGMQAIVDREGESSVLYNLAILERGQNRILQAQELIEGSLKLVESVATDTRDRELQASYFATAHQQYELYIDLLMQLHQQNPRGGFAAKALEASERSRARVLREMLAEIGGEIRQGVDPQLVAQEGAVKEKLNRAIQKRLSILSRTHSQQELDKSQQEIVGLTTEYEQVQSEIRQRRPQYAALTQPASFTVAEIQQLLDDETVLVEFALGDQRSFAWAVTRDRLDSFELPKRAQLEKLARTVYDGLSHRPQDKPAKTRDSYVEAVESLSKTLLAPISRYPKKRVVVVADGVLQYIPFATLQLSSDGEDRRLIADHDVVSLPSASVLAVQRRVLDGRPAASKTLAIVADPVFEADDSRVLLAKSNNSHSPTPTRQPENLKPSRSVARRTSRASHITSLSKALRDLGMGASLRRLFFSRQEANAVFGMIPASEGMKALDFQATRNLVVNDELADYKIIHLATHSFMDNDNPHLSGLVLSMFDERGLPQNGFLQLYEIYNLRLHADLVVLSACQTALGKDLKGEGIVGLTRGFMHAGVPRVIASLWAVEDAATAELMARFYRQMIVNGLRPAAALRAAQLDLSKLKRYNHPYYWAGFVLQGEWK